MSQLFPPKKLSLYYLGERSYVNGLSLAEEMLKCFMQSSEEHPAFIKHFQVSRFVRSNAVVECWKSVAELDRGKVKSAAARIDLTTDIDEARILLLFPLEDEPVNVRLEEYDRKAYVAAVANDEFGNSTAQLANINNMFDLVRGVVEVNHQFVTRKAKEIGVLKGVSWAYLSRFPFLSDADAAKTLSVSYGDFKNFDLRHNRYFIRSLKLGEDDLEEPSEIGFFIPLPATARPLRSN